MNKVVTKLLESVDWKPFLYQVSKNTVLPLCKKYVEDTESKWDDLMYSALELAIDTWLKDE